MSRNARFWRNVVLVALAHVALIAALIRWSVAARAASNPESIVWLGAAGDLSSEESEKQESSSPKRPAEPTEPERVKDDIEEEKTVATTGKSEIELPSPTAKPTPIATPTAHPKPSTTPTPKLKLTPKPTPKSTPKKITVAKASSKPSPKPKSSSDKLVHKSEKTEKTTEAKNKSESSSDSGKTSSTSKGGNAGGGSSASEFGWYGHMLHDRFYSAWIQPTTSVPSASKFAALAKVRIEKDGRISKFEIIKPSDNVVVNESVAAIPKRVSEVDAPPTALLKGDHYDVKINFELNTEEKPPN